MMIAGFCGSIAQVSPYYKKALCCKKACVFRCPTHKHKIWKYLDHVSPGKKRKRFLGLKRSSKRYFYTFPHMVDADFMTFRAKELLEEPVPESESSLVEFLQSCPQRILRNSISPKHTQVLPGQVIRAKLPAIGFFQFQIVPVVDLQ